MVGKELRAARQQAGMTQEELAFKAGVDRSYISLLENDRKMRVPLPSARAGLGFHGRQPQFPPPVLSKAHRRRNRKGLPGRRACVKRSV
jgi:Helix-turn-helix